MHFSKLALQKTGSILTNFDPYFSQELTNIFQFHLIFRNYNISSAYQRLTISLIKAITVRNVLVSDFSFFSVVLFSKTSSTILLQMLSKFLLFTLQAMLLLNLHSQKKVFPPTEVKTSLSFIHGNHTNLPNLVPFANCTSITCIVAFH